MGNNVNHTTADFLAQLAKAQAVPIGAGKKAKAQSEKAEKPVDMTPTVDLSEIIGAARMPAADTGAATPKAAPPTVEMPTPAEKKQKKSVEKHIPDDVDAMTKRAYELTGLENPNSVSQLKQWLTERGIEIDSLGKKQVASMIKEIEKGGLDTEAQDMLMLRLQMAKSSVKKYQAAERCVCDDTVDEDVMAALEQKDITQEKLIHAVRARLGR